MIDRVPLAIHQRANLIVSGVIQFSWGTRNISQPNNTKPGEKPVQTLVLVLVCLVHNLDLSTPVVVLEIYSETTELIRS